MQPMLTTGHTVDPMTVVREQHAAKVRRAANMLAQGALTDAALLQRRCERLARQAEQRNLLHSASEPTLLSRGFAHDLGGPCYCGCGQG